MGVLQIIKLVLELLISLWKDRNDPEKAKLRAAAQLTKELNRDIEAFNQALVANDTVGLSAHFEQLRLRALKATGGGNSGQ
jgi:hypothetical protein